MSPGIAATLAQRGLVVTANNRLARSLRAHFDREQLAVGRRAWRSAAMLPWTAWLRQFWWQTEVGSGRREAARLLTDFQARLAWQTVIDRDPLSRNTWLGTSSRAVARLALASWSTTRAWQMDTAMLVEAADSSDSEAFARWAVAYEDHCGARGWIDEASLAGALAGAQLPQAVCARRPVRLVGFETFTPAQRAFLAALGGAGWDIQIEPLPRIEDGNIRRVHCEDSAEEIALAARWARAALSGGVAGRIAIVVPDLGSRRELVRRAFRDVFVPGWAEGVTAEAPVNISLGTALSDVGLIHAGLTLLRMLGTELDYREVGQLLRSPFVGGAAVEREARAHFDVTFRVRLGLSTPVTRIIDELDSAGLALGSHLRAALGEAGQDSLRLPSAWVRTISQFLVAAGWPGEAALNSEQYQALRTWHELLDAFAASDAVSPQMHRTEAVASLAQLAGEQVFQAETAADGIQVLGVLEALGHSFDHLWVCGLTADKWPPPARPDALLPLQLQRELGLPNSSPERSLERAAAILAAVSHSAPDVYLSCARRDRDEALDASPLIQSYGEISPGAIAAFDGLPRQFQLFEARPASLVQSDVAPPVECSERVPGGTRLMQLQSRCPARAFLEMRLGAFELRTPASGGDARLRGLIVHDALHRIFSDIQSSRQLKKVAQEELEKILHDSVEKAVAAAIPPNGAFARAIGQIESALCTAMLREFLRIELARPAFTIKAVERDREFSLGNLPLRVRPDRVDEMDSGMCMVIDFKTGATTKGSWLGDRPEEPQLPIYALALGATATAFVQLRRSGITWDGISAADVGIDGVMQPPFRDNVHKYEDWTALQAAWRRRLLAMAKEILDGDARLHRYRRDLAEGQWAMLTRIYDNVERDEAEDAE